VTLNITCSDAGRPVSQVSSHLVTIEIGDVNDNVPHFSQTEAYSARVEEGRTTRYLLAVNATDADVGVNGLVRYSIFGQWDKYFTIDERSGVIGIKVSSSRAKLPALESVFN
jgi:protocadherin Fat 1/2/3